MNAKVYRIDYATLAAVLRGERRIRNLPRDAEIHGTAPCEDRHGRCLGLRVHSNSFPNLPTGAQLPVVIAVTEPLEQAQRVAA
jgi:hypothetical protein